MYDVLGVCGDVVFVIDVLFSILSSVCLRCRATQ